MMILWCFSSSYEFHLLNNLINLWLENLLSLNALAVKTEQRIKSSMDKKSRSRPVYTRNVSWQGVADESLDVFDYLV